MRTSSLKQLTQTDHQQYRTRLQVLLFSVRDLKKNGPPLTRPTDTDEQTDTTKQYIEKLSASIARTLYQYHDKIAFNNETIPLDHQREYLRLLGTMREALNHLVYGKTVIGEKTSDAVIRCLCFHIYECEIKMQDSLPDQQNYQHPWITVSKLLFQKQGDQKYCIETSIDIDKITQHIQGCLSTIHTLIEFTNKPSFLDVNDIKEKIDSIATHIADFFHSSHVQHNPNDNDGYDIKGHGIVIDKPNKADAKDEWELLYSGIKKTLEHHLVYRHIDHGLCQPIKQHLDSILNHLYQHRASIIQDDWKSITRTLMYRDKLPELPQKKIQAIRNAISCQNKSSHNLKSSKELFIEAIKSGLIISSDPAFNLELFLSLLNHVSEHSDEHKIETELTLLLRSLKSFIGHPLPVDNALPEDLFCTEYLNKKSPKKKKNKKKNAEKTLPQPLIDSTDNDYTDKNNPHLGLTQECSDTLHHQAAIFIQRTFIESRARKDLDSLQNTMKDVVSLLFSEPTTTSLQIQTFFNHLEKSLNEYTLERISQSDTIHMFFESLVTASAEYLQGTLRPKTTIAWIPVDKIKQLIEKEHSRTTQSRPYQELILSKSSAKTIVRLFMKHRMLKQKDRQQQLSWFHQLSKDTQTICQSMYDMMMTFCHQSEILFFGSRLCEGSPIEKLMVDSGTDMDFLCLIPHIEDVNAIAEAVQDSIKTIIDSKIILRIDQSQLSASRAIVVIDKGSMKKIRNLKLLCTFNESTTPIDLTIMSITHQHNHQYQGSLFKQYLKLLNHPSDGQGISLSVIRNGQYVIDKSLVADLQRNYTHGLQNPTISKTQIYRRNNLRHTLKTFLRALVLDAKFGNARSKSITPITWEFDHQSCQGLTRHLDQPPYQQNTFGKYSVPELNLFFMNQFKKHFMKELHTLFIHKTPWLVELKKNHYIKDIFAQLFNLCWGSNIPTNNTFSEFFDHICRTVNATRSINDNFMTLFHMLFGELNAEDQKKREDWLNVIIKGDRLEDTRSPQSDPQARPKISGNTSVAVCIQPFFTLKGDYIQKVQSSPLKPDVNPSRGPSP